MHKIHEIKFQKSIILFVGGGGYGQGTGYYDGSLEENADWIGGRGGDGIVIRGGRVRGNIVGIGGRGGSGGYYRRKRATQNPPIVESMYLLQLTSIENLSTYLIIKKIFIILANKFYLTGRRKNILHNSSGLYNFWKCATIVGCYFDNLKYYYKFSFDFKYLTN